MGAADISIQRSCMLSDGKSYRINSIRIKRYTSNISNTVYIKSCFFSFATQFFLKKTLMIAVRFRKRNGGKLSKCLVTKY